jgi:dienelactone hydrolase
MRGISMRCYFSALVVVALSLPVLRAGDDPTALQLKTVSGHPMKYYLSLPHGWATGKEWPTVVVIDSANREFRSNAELFVQARKKQPFLLVAPLVVSNGGPKYRQAPGYRYSAADWTDIERVGIHRFDRDGIAALIREVKKLHGGSEQAFLTGWEAGGHTVWAQVFRQPEILRGVALCGPNFAARGLDDGPVSNSAARTRLPVRVFVGTLGTPWGEGLPLFAQWERARQFAADNGYRNVSLTLVEGKKHGPLPDEVLSFFTSLLKKPGADR